MKLGFIGAGNMARAMVSGLLSQGAAAKEDILCVSGSGPSAQRLSKEFGIGLADSRRALINAVDILILAFKPQHVETLTPEEGAAADGKLIVSVLAGRRIEAFRKAFPDARNIIRVMPNTPSKIGKGVSAFCFEKDPNHADRQALQTILASLGTSHEVSEAQMHIATAISGSGPAAFVRFVDLIAKAGEKNGLPHGLSLALATETGIGALELLSSSQLSPQELIDEVTSPNGVTHALIQGYEKRELGRIIEESITEAVARSKELSQAK